MSFRTLRQSKAVQILRSQLLFQQYVLSDCDAIIYMINKYLQVPIDGKAENNSDFVIFYKKLTFLIDYYILIFKIIADLTADSVKISTKPGVQKVSFALYIV